MSDPIFLWINKIISGNWKKILFVLLLLNFFLRLIIFRNTNLFNFSDYKFYLSGVERIHDIENINILNGNFLLTLSYLGYLSKYFLGNISYFYILNCLLGTMTTYILSILIFKLSGNVVATIVTAVILTFYPEFMIFSTVFYTPVIMLFLLALFVYFLFYYYTSSSIKVLISSSILLFIVYIVTFLFKPELLFFPVFLFLVSLGFIKKQKSFFQRTFYLFIILVAGILLIKASGIYKKSEATEISNDFVFFGHTDYGGNGGEGSFILPENKARYDEALSKYCYENKIINPTVKDRNQFQISEITHFVTQHPLKWIKLQFTKFFRTFGVVPETTSFKILYTGLFKGHLWLTSIVIVVPVALIILLFITFFNISYIKQLFNSSTFQPFNFSTHSSLNTQRSTLNAQPSTLNSRHQSSANRLPITDYKKHFFYVYFLLFFYYLIISIFLGQYQERYRMPLMVIFIIPTLGFFIASFNKNQFLKRSSLIIKSVVIVLFITVWTFQAKKAIYNKQRFQNAIESMQSQIGK